MRQSGEQTLTEDRVSADKAARDARARRREKPVQEVNKGSLK